jgi:riboflavin biosynthesis pyrimidine reductase
LKQLGLLSRQADIRRVTGASSSTCGKLSSGSAKHGDRRGETHGCEILGVPRVGGTLDVSAIRTALGDRGLSVVFVEGGGITISHFLEAGCLNRLQITVAPIIIGSGRPGGAFPGDRALNRALRPRIRRFDLGGDTLFDCYFDA